MTSPLTIVGGTSTARNAEVVADRVRRALPWERASVEPRPDGGRVHRGALPVEAATWAEAVLDMLRAARRLGGDLPLTGDVERDSSVIVARPSVVGVAWASLDLRAPS